MALLPPAPDTTVLVTGASAGIGTELARQLGGRGHDLTLVARREERLRELAEEIGASRGVHVEVDACDLGDPAARAELVRRVQRRKRAVVGLCNNAGFGSFGRFVELPQEREAEEVSLNVQALHELCGAFLPAMVKQGSGAILNTGSVAGYQPQPMNATYAATKAFVNSFSEALHAELSGTGVSCTVLAPGPVKTEFAERAGMGRFNGAGPDFLWGTPEQVARAGIDGMVRGRRTVVPRAGDKVAAAMGRFTPRSVLLPVLQRVGDRNL